MFSHKYTQDQHNCTSPCASANKITRNSQILTSPCFFCISILHSCDGGSDDRLRRLAIVNAIADIKAVPNGVRQEKVIVESDRSDG